MATVIERRYQMTRLRSGDYLLPDNDEQTLWRITRYEERDGSLLRGDGTEIRGDFWALWRCRLTFDEVTDDDWILENGFVVDDWNYWVEVHSLLPTRQAAIEAAMRPALSPLRE